MEPEGPGRLEQALVLEGKDPACPQPVILPRGPFSHFLYWHLPLHVASWSLVWG